MTRETNPRAAPLALVVGHRIHELRQEMGIRQDDIAAAANRFGFGWGRSSVAQLENGTRGLSAEELLALPYIVANAAKLSGAIEYGQTAGVKLSLLELLKPGGDTDEQPVPLALAENLTLSHDDLAGLVSDRQVRTRAPSGMPVITEGDRKAAKRLGISVEALAKLTERMWGRTFTERRDAIAADEGDQRARRGHTSRQLLAELQAELDRRARRSSSRKGN